MFGRKPIGDYSLNGLICQGIFYGYMMRRLVGLAVGEWDPFEIASVVPGSVP